MPPIPIVAGAIALALSAPALAQSAPPPLDLKGEAERTCTTGSADELVVCGQRQRSPYRIDPTVLDSIRSKEAASNPPKVQDRSGNAEACGTGRNECGGDMIPLLEPALRVAAAVVKAVEGDDWREPFRNGPGDYERYRDAKQKRGRASVSIGISASSERE